MHNGDTNLTQRRLITPESRSKPALHNDKSIKVKNISIKKRDTNLNELSRNNFDLKQDNS